MAFNDFMGVKSEDLDGMLGRNYVNMVAEPGKGPGDDATRICEEQDAVWICMIEAEKEAIGIMGCDAPAK